MMMRLYAKDLTHLLRAQIGLKMVTLKVTDVTMRTTVIKLIPVMIARSMKSSAAMPNLEQNVQAFQTMPHATTPSTIRALIGCLVQNHKDINVKIHIIVTVQFPATQIIKIVVKIFQLEIMESYVKVKLEPTVL